MKKIALLNRLLRPLLLIGAMAVLTAAFYMFNQNVEAIQHSKKLGIRFSLDHFGTGYASLIHLRQLPIDTIKIDRALTHNMMNNPIDLALITAVIQLSQELNQQVIAQGAQTNKHLRLLKNLNCHTAQGDGIAKPMPANQVSNWLSANNPFRF
ncbi:MAG: EAL domain-containing protein [Methylophilaceae bacterium]|nr:EAL domain-containing protein [Methylophilaceae bacterium]